MSINVDFDILLSAAGGDNLDDLDTQLEKLAEEKRQLRRRMREITKDMQRLSEERAIPVRAAVRAAKQLGVDVPKQYQDHRRTPGNRKKRTRYEWSSPGCRTKYETVSSAMWRLSRGSGGNGGNADQGVLLTGEFWDLVKSRVGKQEHEIEEGEEVTLELPNGRTVSFRRGS